MPVDRRTGGRAARSRPGTAALEMQRTYKTSDGEVAQVTDQHPPVVAVPAFDDHAPGQGAGRAVRVDEQRAADAYRRGLWVRETLADSLRDAARATPDRTVLVDGDIRLDCRDPARAGDRAGAGPDGADARRQRGVVHAAELARGRRHLPRRDAGRHGGEPDPAVAAGSRAAVHPVRRRQPGDLRAVRHSATTTTPPCWTG